ncbi:hypothetical protein INR49_031665, partial [Caranx melampygus]
MKVHHTLICLFLSLQDGNTGLTDAQQLHTGTEGGNITVTCSFRLHGNTKYFCRNKCKGDDKLIETKEDSSQRDRYRIEYDRGWWTEKAVLNVSITHLNKSDSGRYRCGLDGSFSFLDRYKDFELRVTDEFVLLIFTSVNIKTEEKNHSSTSRTKPDSSTFVHITLTSSFTTECRKPRPFITCRFRCYFLVVVVCVSVLVAVVLLAVVVLLLLYIQKKKDCCGSEWRGNMDHTNMECISNEYMSPPSTCEDSIYQGLDPASRNQDQTYSTLTLQDGNTGLTDAQQLYRRTEGGNITVTCLFRFHGNTKYFCRSECKGDDKLIETKEDSSQRDRYRIEYDRRGWREKAVLYVSITHLNKSDSGWYRCGLGERIITDGYEDFELRVTDEFVLLMSVNIKTEEKNHSNTSRTKPDSSTSRTKADSNTSRTKADSNTSRTKANSSTFVHITLTSSFTTDCRKLRPFINLCPQPSACRSSCVLSSLGAGCPQQCVVVERPSLFHMDVRENIEYEEIREDRRSRPPPVEVNTLYTTATHTTPTPAEASDVYSVPTVPAAVAPDSAEDVSYADVNVVASLHKTSADRTDVSTSTPLLLHISSYTHIYIYIYSHIYSYIYIYIYSYTYIYTH